jgi:hypothetical protein
VEPEPEWITVPEPDLDLDLGQDFVQILLLENGAKNFLDPELKSFLKSETNRNKPLRFYNIGLLYSLQDTLVMRLAFYRIPGGDLKKNATLLYGYVAETLLK